jgi:hypothetical protein
LLLQVLAAEGALAMSLTARRRELCAMRGNLPKRFEVKMPSTFSFFLDG